MRHLQELPLTSEEGLTTTSNVTLSTYQKVDHADFGGKKCFWKKCMKNSYYVIWCERMCQRALVTSKHSSNERPVFFESKRLLLSLLLRRKLLSLTWKHSSSWNSTQPTQVRRPHYSKINGIRTISTPLINERKHDDESYHRIFFIPPRHWRHCRR